MGCFVACAPRNDDDGQSGCEVVGLRRHLPQAIAAQAVAAIRRHRQPRHFLGAAAGDFVNAASDPRGFVKAELNHPNGGLLEVPGLSSTPALASAVFAYQLEVQQARAAAAKSGAPASGTAPPSPETKAQGRNLSLNSIAMDTPAKEGAMPGKENGGA